MPIPTNNVAYPVLVSNKSGAVASGFFYRGESSIYFITAKHVLLNRESDLLVKRITLTAYGPGLDWTKPTIIKLDLSKISSENRIKYNDDNDAIVLQIGECKSKDKISAMAGVNFQGPGIVTAAPENIRFFSDVEIGNDAYLFGYPSSLGIEKIPQIDYKKPLLRKGSIAQKNDIQNTIILDCPVYFGNSGGPVTEYYQASLNEYKCPIIGVVSQTIPYVDEWQNRHYGYTNRYFENSGYSVVVPMDPVMAIIQQFTVNVSPPEGTGTK